MSTARPLVFAGSASRRLSEKVCVPVGRLFAEAIRRQEENLSLSELSLAAPGAAR